MTTIYATAAGGRAVEQRYREILRLWPVPSEWLSVPTREGETFVVACGPPDAPPLLLLHGAAANSAMWMGDVASRAAGLPDLRRRPGGRAGPERMVDSFGTRRRLDEQCLMRLSVYCLTLATS